MLFFAICSVFVRTISDTYENDNHNQNKKYEHRHLRLCKIIHYITRLALLVASIFLNHSLSQYNPQPDWVMVRILKIQINRINEAHFHIR